MSISARASALLHLLRAHFAADAVAWGLTPRNAGVIAVIPIVVASLVAAARLSRPLSGFLTDEGSVLELAQVALLVVAAGAFAACTARLVRAASWAGAALGAAAVVVLSVVIGEELSWGQSATNLHLLRDVIRAINFAMIFAAGGLVLLTIAVVARRRAQRPAGRLAELPIPPLALVPAFAIPFAYRSVRLVTDGGASGPFSEMSELSLYFGIAVYAVLVLRRLGVARAAAR